MAKAKEDRDDLETVTLRLYSGDKDIISSYFPKQGYNRVIRKLVRKFINQLQSTPVQQETAHDNLPDINLTVE
jgi:hypothetical protein